MTVERELASFAATHVTEGAPPPVREVVGQVLMTVVGTAVAGAREDGVREALAVYGEPAGERAARVLVHGTRVPAAAAATINGLMARALDYCDAMAPGLHIGSSLVPAALAAAEWRGGCTGREFVAALTVGAELASRMNLAEQGYAGLDPTGIAGVFGATAAAARVLGLDAARMHQALALAFNRCAGSFQSNIDGTLAVRMIQGWVAGDGFNCARLAQEGLTGPANFIAGEYGYAKLYAGSPSFLTEVREGLGRDYRLLKMMFKKYPSCGMSQGATELALRMLRKHELVADQVASVEVRVPAYGYKLVGHRFVLGSNPRVNAQFSLQYCIANALVRRSSTLEHFRPESIADAAVLALAERIEPIHDAALDARDHTSVALTVRMRDGRVLQDSLDIAPGFPGQSLGIDEHRQRFDACMAYGGKSPAQARKLLDRIESIAGCDDVRELVGLTM